MAIREFRLPDPGEGLVEADIVTWRVAVGDRSRSTTSWSRWRPASRWSSCPARTPARSPSCWSPRATRSTSGRRSSPSTTGQALTSGAARPRTTWSRRRRDRRGPHRRCGRDRRGGRRRRADGSRCWSATGRRPPKPSGGRASRTAAIRRAGRGPRAGRRTFATDPRRCPAGPTSGSRCTPRPGERGRRPAAGSRTAGSEPVPASRTAVLAKPPVRKLAKDLGVDLRAADRHRSRWSDHPRRRRSVRPSTYAGAPTAPVASAAGAVKTSGSRSRASARPPPRPWCSRRSPRRTSREWVTCDVSATMELVERLGPAGVRRGAGVAAADRRQGGLPGPARTPELNSAWDEAAQEIVVKSAVNLGIAAATPRGLVVPNIKDAASLGLVGPGPGAQGAGGHRPGR